MSLLSDVLFLLRLLHPSFVLVGGLVVAHAHERALASARFGALVLCVFDRFQTSSPHDREFLRFEPRPMTHSAMSVMPCMILSD